MGQGKLTALCVALSDPPTRVHATCGRQVLVRQALSRPRPPPLCTGHLRHPARLRPGFTGRTSLFSSFTGLRSKTGTMRATPRGPRSWLSPPVLGEARGVQKWKVKPPKGSETPSMNPGGHCCAPRAVRRVAGTLRLAVTAGQGAWARCVSQRRFNGKRHF